MKPAQRLGFLGPKTEHWTLKKSFTLIELLIVVSILVILAGAVIIVINPLKRMEQARVASAFQFAGYIDRSLSFDIAGQWDFDDSSIPSQASDKSGNLNNGTITGATYNCNNTPHHLTGQQAGKCALSFDGNDSVTVLNSSSLDIASNKFTITAWFYPNVNVTNMVSTYPILLIKRPWLVGGYAAHFTKGDGKINVQYCKLGGISCPGVQSRTSFKAGTWYHYAGTFDGTNVSVYIDGKRETKSSQPGTMGPSTTNSLSIGSNFEGLIDDVHVYSNSLTAMQIQQMYAQTASKYYLALSKPLNN